MSRNFKVIVIAIAVYFATDEMLKAQEVLNDFQTRTDLDISFKPIKKLKLSLNPELRFDNNFSPDKYLLEGEVEYKALKMISFGASYGLVGKVRNEKSNSYYTRYSFSTTISKKFMRFDPSFRLMYSNYADDEIIDKNFLRYKAAISYNIRDCKITPFAAVQLFQDVNNRALYKTRYAAGADYKLFKKNYIKVSYKFDYYQNEYKNRHIFSVGYKLKF